MGRMTPEQRHKNMAAIRSKDTSIEVKLRKALWHHGYRYRKNYTALPGSPDIAITKHRIAIFCDSEFFHGKLPLQSTALLFSVTASSSMEKTGIS